MAATVSGQQQERLALQTPPSCTLLSSTALSVASLLCSSGLRIKNECTNDERTAAKVEGRTVAEHHKPKTHVVRARRIEHTKREIERGRRVVCRRKAVRRQPARGAAKTGHRTKAEEQPGMPGCVRRASSMGSSLGTHGRGPRSISGAMAPVSTMAPAVAKPFQILSAYLITPATSNPPTPFTAITPHVLASNPRRG